MDAKANLMQQSSRLPKTTTTSPVFRVTSQIWQIDRLYAVVKEQKGHIDILFANAGIGEFAPLGEISEVHFDKTFGINVKGLLFSVQKALPLFQDGDGGGSSFSSFLLRSKYNKMSSLVIS